MADIATTENLRKFFLPSLAVIEAIGTKGKSPGTAALTQQQAFQSLDQQREQARQRALQERLAEAKFEEIERKAGISKQQRAALERLGTKIQSGEVDPNNRGQLITAMFSEGLTQEALGPALKIIQPDFFTKLLATTQIKGQQAETDAARKAREKEQARQQKLADDQLKREQKLEDQQRLAEQKALQPRPLPATQATDIGATKQSIQTLDKMINSAGKLGLSFSPLDIARALIPWDVDAKSFQQYVQTTKQVIGKGLEGGVLRKEDEVKYEKIIPRLGDTRKVLIAKANQLRDLLVNKHATTLESLQNANFDVKKFEAIEPIQYEFSDIFQSENKKSGKPKIGDIEDGHRFLGGDPANPSSWEKI